MRIIQNPDNGNVAAGDKSEDESYTGTDNRSWLVLNNTTQSQNSSKFRDNHNKNCNNGYVLINSKEIKGQDPLQNIKGVYTSEDTVETEICNRQYRINNLNEYPSAREKFETNKLDSDRENTALRCESSPVNDNIYSDSTPTPNSEDHTFGNSDTDEMSENVLQTLPRGIVNPNYPGFQHLAHTLQDYSTNIDTFYQSENEMTDDDLDVDIIDTTQTLETNKNEINCNNNNTSDYSPNEICELQLKAETSNLETQNDIPDLLKTISNNNNIESSSYDCSATDIENNFGTKDIIGDFNKEIEEEIKQLLNYNINIQDDLEELRKDIKDTFAKPIENTINNISDVVNHVIKKLVETHNDTSENFENKVVTTYTDLEEEELNSINKENETNTRTEMNLSRPTFLYIDNHPNNKIKDAVLSDGKDEITIYENEYDTELLSHNVENTIKQLSTELRKIIPKLNEMRERDRLWTENLKETSSVLMDTNSNEVHGSINYSNNLNVIPNETVQSDNIKNNSPESRNTGKFRRPSAISPSIKRASTDRHNTFVIKASNAQNTASVLPQDNNKDYNFESFDVYNIETALPKIDLDAIENHLRAAKEAERRKRNDREEIRKRLAMDADNDEYYSLGHTDRPGKKPSLHSRLQNGKNLQICFMNETASDNESQVSDIDKNLHGSNKSLTHSSIFGKSSHNHPYQTRPLSVNITKNDKISTSQSGNKLRPSSFILKTSKSCSTQSLNHIDIKETDFYTLQASLQTEARIALAQAKEMAHVQMERERLSRAVSPVTEMLRHSMEKANAPLAPDRRRVSRQLLTDMNIAQLQVIVNELHSQIESLNDTLVKLLMARDELHMGQDSMLVDIEDLTRYLGVKEQTKKPKGTTKSGMRRLTSLVQK